MKVQKLSAGFAAILITAWSSAAPDTGAAPAVDALIAAQYYAIGFTGIGGMQSPGQTAVIRLHAMPERSLLFREAFERGGPVAKTYVACWASAFDQRLFEDAKYELLGRLAHTSITTINGSVMSQARIEVLVKNMQSSKCGELALSGQH